MTNQPKVDYVYVKDSEQPYLKIGLSDYALITNPILNKGMAFPDEERREFGLIGLLPPHVTDLNFQRERSYLALKSKPSPIEKYIYLRDLQDSNETLFYSLLCSRLEECLPIVYTPTVGLGCQTFSHVYRRARGVFIAYPYRKEIDKILSNPRFNHVKVIVVSDGERILGLGDQGAGGMGIPIGKLSLYTACAGIHPTHTLPILLDTGTNNADLLKDPLYIGWRHERIRGKEYDDFIADFITAVKKRFPHVLLQWEDFAKINATPLLERYQNQLCTFNDDIQGTAAVAAGALFAAIHITGKKLSEQRIVLAGAGSAGCGISELLLRAMIDEGLSEEEASKHFYLVDSNGLLTTDTPNLFSFQKKFAQSKSHLAHWQLRQPDQISLMDVVSHVHPTVLIGVSGQYGIFTESLIKEMAAHVERPIIFPLSNPPSKCEANPHDVLNWTNGKAIISTGSPFPDVIKHNQAFRIDQTNNCYIFPGLGLGLISIRAKYVTPHMFMIAAKALAETSPTKLDPNANLLAPLTQIREISLHVAIAVAKEAIRLGIANKIPADDIETHVRKFMWTPAYLPYKKL